MKPVIYLDTCCIQRPLDSKTNLRIALEAEAVLGILILVEKNKVNLDSSEIFLFETNRNSNQIRKEYALEVISKAKEYVSMNPKIEKRSKELVDLGIHFLEKTRLYPPPEGGGIMRGFSKPHARWVRKTRRSCSSGYLRSGNNSFGNAAKA
jgi:hypothetical protein